MKSTPTKEANDEELRTLFNFLGGEQNSKNENLKASNIKFGLENYGLPLDEEVVKSMKLAIDKKSINDVISFQNFKSLWNAKENTSGNDSHVAKYMFQLLFEYLKEKYQDKGELRLDAENLSEVLSEFEVFNDENEDERKRIANEMIECLATNGKYVVLKDFEVLINQYMKTSKKKDV